MRLTTRAFIDPCPWAGIILVLIGVFRFPTSEFRLSFTILAEMGVVLWLGAVIGRRVNVWWGGFLVLSLLSSVYPYYTRYSFLTLHSVTLMAVWYYLVATTFSRRQVEWLLNAMCVVAVVHFVFVVMQTFGYDPLFVAKKGGTVPVGLMSNRNETSCLFALCLPAFMRPKWMYIPLFVPLSGLVLTKTSMEAIAGALGLSWFIWIETKSLKTTIVWAGGGCFLLMALFMVFVDSPGFERWEAWTQGFAMWRQHPVFGAGLGHWKIVASEHIQASAGYFKTAHNEYLQGLFEMGIGLPVLVGGYFGGIWRRWRKGVLDPLPVMAVIIVAISSIGHFVFHIGVTAIIAVTWMAVLEVDAK